MKNIIYPDDCLKVLPNIPADSIDMILCDLPYGITQNKWDCDIDLEKLWQEYKRVTKPNAAIVLFGQNKFSANLVMSCPELYRYSLVWEKTTPTGFLNANRMPLRSHEDILVFYKKLPTYNPQKTTGHKRKVSTSKHKDKSEITHSSNYGKYNVADYDSTERFPKSVLKFKTDRQKSKLHPTQKPLKLIEYLIKTYSNEGDLILDNAAGSGTVGLASQNLNRDFILIEKHIPYALSINDRLSDK